MSLQVKYIELLTDPLKSSIQNYPAYDTDVKAGRTVYLNTDGFVVLSSAATNNILGVALNTPSAAGDMVAVLRKGKVRVLDDSSNTYIAANPAEINDLVYVTTAGKWSTSGLAIGMCTKVVSAIAPLSFEAEVNFETASCQPSA